MVISCTKRRRDRASAISSASLASHRHLEAQPPPSPFVPTHTLCVSRALPRSGDSCHAWCAGTSKYWIFPKCNSAGIGNHERKQFPGGERRKRVLEQLDPCSKGDALAIWSSAKERESGRGRTERGGRVLVGGWVGACEGGCRCVGVASKELLLPVRWLADPGLRQGALYRPARVLYCCVCRCVYVH